MCALPCRALTATWLESRCVAVNELYLSMDDIADAAEKGDQKAAMASWERGKDYLNGFLRIVNLPINARVGDKFALVPAELVRAPPAAPAAE